MTSKDDSGGKVTATLMGAGATTGAATAGPPGAFLGGIAGGVLGVIECV